MRLIRASLGPAWGERMVFAFPEALGHPEPIASRLSYPEPIASRLLYPEPIAALSLAALGDMKFGEPGAAANRERFLSGLGIAPRAALGLSLAHSRNVLFPEPGDDVAALASAAGGADGLIVRDRCLAPTVTVSDCMPIWLLDRDSGAFGVLHSGWKGTGILGVAVRALASRFGSRPSAMAAILGPSIGSCCYPVPESRAAVFAAEFGEASVLRGQGDPRLDLRQANIALAEGLGLGALLSVDSCTSCDPRFGSYRRQGSAAFTRMLAVCAYSSAAPEQRPEAS